MALQLIDGFDHYGDAVAGQLQLAGYVLSNDAYVKAATSTYEGVTAGRTGPGWLHLRSTTRSYLLYHPISSHVTQGAGCALMMVIDGTTRSKVMMFANSNNHVLQVIPQPDGSISLYRNGSNTSYGTLIGSTDAGLMALGAYKHVEVIMGYHATAGTVELWVGGALAFSATGIAFGITQPDVFGIYSTTSNIYGGARFAIDDLVLWDGSGSVNNSRMGDLQVSTQHPSGNGSEQDWTYVGGASAWQSIADIAADDDTSYITDSATGVSTFDFENLVDAGAIRGVRLVTIGRKTDAGTAIIETTVLSNGSNSAADTNALGTSYGSSSTVVELDPDTGAPFTVSAINAAQIQIERVT